MFSCAKPVFERNLVHTRFRSKCCRPITLQDYLIINISGSNTLISVNFSWIFPWILWCLGVVVIAAAQIHSTKPELRFCTSSSPARGVSEIRNGEDL